MNKKEKPRGLVIFGNVNFFIFGVLSLIVFGFLYLNISTEAGGTFLNELSKNFSQEQLNQEHLKVILRVQLLIAATFLTSGAGLILGKEWARKLTIYFCFFMVVLVFVSVIFNPQVISQAIFQIIYPGVLIFYFTNKKVENFFKSKKEQGEQE